MQRDGLQNAFKESALEQPRNLMAEIWPQNKTEPPGGPVC